jgi:hypothetical protein
MMIDPDAEKKQEEFLKKQNMREYEKKREEKELEKMIKKANKLKHQQDQKDQNDLHHHLIDKTK